MDKQNDITKALDSFIKEADIKLQPQAEEQAADLDLEVLDVSFSVGEPR